MRKIASREGALYYGAEVGTPITKEMVTTASAANGGKRAPRGASRHAQSTTRRAAATGAQNAAQRPATGTRAPAADARSYKPELIDGGPSFSGTEQIQVGGLTWGVTPGSQVVSSGPFSWVLTSGAGGPELHCLIAHEGRVREVDVPARMREQAMLKYFAEAT